MILHARELTDPIRQFNDHGYAMCSTVAGMNCAIWGAMGYKVKFWDISLHTVPEVEYDGAWHMYDSSLSALYTRCDGKTIASVTEIGATGACEASGGKNEPGHIAKYHCLNATSKNGYLTGCDTIRSVAEEYRCFNPKGLKFRYYLNNWDLGHRYILNLRDGEVYTRNYRRLDADSPNAVLQLEKRPKYMADPAYFTPNEKTGKDPEAKNPRYFIRGNGLRTWTPPLTAAGLAANAYTMTGLRAADAVRPLAPGKPGELVFKVEGANVIASMTVKGTFGRRTDADVNAVAVSTTNGMQWKEVWKNDKLGETSTDIRLNAEVNGAYEVLVKVQLDGKAAASNAALKKIAFETITQINSKTQPRLKLGRNTVYVGTGDQTESTVFWPDLHGELYKPYVVEMHNAKIADDPKPFRNPMHAVQTKKDSWVVFRMDAPRDITRITYGGRFSNRGPKAHTDLLHSFDGGKTWQKTVSLTDATPPWDIIHYETVDRVPAGVKSVLFKYLWYSSANEVKLCGPYSVRMEANYKPADVRFKPLEVTFNWSERQADYSLVKRRHTQLVTQVPFTYVVNVGGTDHPVMDSLRVNLKGAAGDVAYGYADGKDVGGEKFQERWVTYGRNLAEGKPYTCSIPSGKGWGAGDPDNKKLTDGIVGPPVSGGVAFRPAALWRKGSNPEITVDLGKTEKCGAFRVQLGGFPWWNAIKGEVKDTVELLVSNDGKEFKNLGFFDLNLRWKDIPANHAFNDDEKFCGHNFEMIPEKPVEARYVRFAITPKRGAVTVSEVQVLDFIRYEPFDLRIALPDGKDRSDIAKYNPKHTPMKPYKRNRRN